MSLPLVSIIVPVYNVEKYLNDCLQSIVEQSYSNLEIIVVDDGSPDNSIEIARDFAKKDSRIKVHQKENGGLSSARNFGIDQSIGEFLYFIDSDDLISTTNIEQLVKHCVENKAKMVMSMMTHELEKVQSITNSVAKVIHGDFLTLLIESNKPEFVSVAACNKLFHVSIFEKFRFPEGMIYEDAASYLYIVEQLDKIVLCDLYGYYYRPNESSITTQNISRKNFDILKACQMRVEVCQERHPEALPYIYRKCLNDNDFVAMRCVSERSDISEELFNSLLEANRLYSKSSRLRRFMYKSDRIYRLFLLFISTVYYNEKFRAFVKRILN